MNLTRKRYYAEYVILSIQSRSIWIQADAKTVIRNSTRTAVSTIICILTSADEADMLKGGASSDMISGEVFFIFGKLSEVISCQKKACTRNRTGFFGYDFRRSIFYIRKTIGGNIMSEERLYQ